MSMNSDRFHYLLSNYRTGSISPSERDELFELISSHTYDQLLANSILDDLKKGDYTQTAMLPPHIAEEMVRSIFQAEKNTRVVLPSVRKVSFKAWRWMAAASIIFAVFGYLFVRTATPSRTQKAFSSLIPVNTITRTNFTDVQKEIILPDESHVVLQPKSTIHYRTQFAADKREVFLQGEAFFKVTKNPSRPFLVYYNNIVTRVLGTSFTINTNSSTGNVEVSVKTGRVQVYENSQLVKDTVSQKSVILSPNQRAVYKPRERVFETMLVDKPEPIVDDSAAQETPVSFVYEQEKLQNVFRHIEVNYGIEIILENIELNDCVFTGDVSQQDLETKLKLICLATNSSYEINGTKILIKGKGCK